MDVSRLTPVERMKGESIEETRALRSMLGQAETYLRSFAWCPPIAARYFGFGVGGVIALFLFELESALNGTDKWLWVVEGDLPSAYFVTDDAHDAASALEVYCDLMEHWCDSAEKGEPLDDEFPVDVAPTLVNVNSLRARIGFIRNRLLPTL